MPKSQFVDFSLVKKSVSMRQILDHYQLTNKLQQKGDSLSGVCPIHTGDNPTQFRVSLSKNCWNCFGQCKRGGNIIDFVSLKEGVTIREAALRIQEWFNLPSRKSAWAPAPDTTPLPDNKEPGTSKKTKEPESKPEGSDENKPLSFSLEHLDPAHPYLAERGLTPETVETFGLGFCKKGLLTGHIAIPIHNAAGQIVAYAGRWPGQPPDGKPKYKLPAGFKKSLELFNLHRAASEPSEQPLVIVEGFFDCLKLWQHGLRRVVALMGSSLSPAQEELIRDHTSAWSQVLVMLDEDDAGRAGRDDIVGWLSRWLFVKVHVFPTEGMQPDQMSADEVEQLFGGGA